ncbi:MAG: YqgE/AlgH family protein [Flavobacteriales bacterium]|nr:YqgE/AlgH family protein [Flavobacteriales bacterium]
MSTTPIPPEKGRILISEPFLADPNFMRSVVLLTEHNEEGTVGFVLNHALELSLADVVADVTMPDIPLIKGGPVELNTIHFIHVLGSEIGESMPIKPGLWWGGNFEDAMDHIRRDPDMVRNFKFFLGYSGWSPGQLDEELERDSWIVSSIAPSEALSPVLESQQLWKKAMSRLGGEFRILSNSPLDPQWN